MSLRKGEQMRQDRRILTAMPVKLYRRAVLPFLPFSSRLPFQSVSQDFQDRCARPQASAVADALLARHQDLDKP